MIDLVLTVMISALSLAQPGHAAITTNELPPPPGLSASGTTAPPDQSGAAAKTQQLSAPKPGAVKASDKTSSHPETRSQASTANANSVVVDDAKPVFVKPTPAPAPSDSEASQPTTEERQAPTEKQASGAASPGRVAAFWFILPNRPSSNK